MSLWTLTITEPDEPMIRAAGFEVEQLDRDTLRHVPPSVRPLVVGVAQSAC